MERRRLQRHGHLFGHGHCQHLSDCDIHLDYASVSQYRWGDALKWVVS
jgi:hypothetical protein